ncbi:unnamed protein product, partial [Polarella glacialis]
EGVVPLSDQRLEDCVMVTSRRIPNLKYLFNRVTGSRSTLPVSAEMKPPLQSQLQRPHGTQATQATQTQQSLQMQQMQQMHQLQNMHAMQMQQSQQLQQR